MQPNAQTNALDRSDRDVILSSRCQIFICLYQVTEIFSISNFAWSRCSRVCVSRGPWRFLVKSATARESVCHMQLYFSQGEGACARAKPARRWAWIFAAPNSPATPNSFWQRDRESVRARPREDARSVYKCKSLLILISYEICARECVSATWNKNA